MTHGRDTPTYLRKLLRQLPDTFQELSENGRHLLWISIQLITPESDNNQITVIAIKTEQVPVTWS